MVLKKRHFGHHNNPFPSPQFHLYSKWFKQYQRPSFKYQRWYKFSTNSYENRL